MLRRSHSTLDYLLEFCLRLYVQKTGGRKYEATTLRTKMQQIKIVRTVFSLAAIAGSIVVVSWVGLALLGY